MWQNYFSKKRGLGSYSVVNQLLYVCVDGAIFAQNALCFLVKSGLGEVKLGVFNVGTKSTN